ncbi:MAG: Gmad2 immunoglobulin-like domain-containing protein [Actinomycetota bacterium]
MRSLARLLLAVLPMLFACSLASGATPSAVPAPIPTTGPFPDETPASAEPAEAIRITAPGQSSRLVSPMSVHVTTTLPAFENTLTLRVLLDDGTDLVPPQAVIGSEIEGGALAFNASLSFSTTEERPAFLQAYLASPRDGGVTHLASVVVTVMPGGAANVRPAAGDDPERLQISLPAAGDALRGGVVHVEGIGVASLEQTLLIEVVDAYGVVIGLQPVLVQAPDFGLPGPFAADVTYTLTAAGPGRVVVRDISPAHGGDIHRSSVEIDLAP